MLVWSMRCGSVLLLGLIGIEGTRVFRKKVAILGVFLFLGTRIGLMLGAMGGWPGRGAFVGEFGQRCGRGGLGSAARGYSR